MILRVNVSSASLMKVFEVHVLNVFSSAVKKSDFNVESGSQMKNVFAELLHAYVCVDVFDLTMFRYTKGNAEIQQLARKWLDAIIALWPPLIYQTESISCMLDACDNVVNGPSSNLCNLSVNGAKEKGYFMLKLTYECLSRACLRAPHLTIAMLEEYIILSGSNTIPGQHHFVGVDIATEFCTFGRPMYHLSHNAQSKIPFADLRCKASRDISDSLMNRSVDTASEGLPEAYCVTEVIALKSRYIGEAHGRHLTESNIDTYNSIAMLGLESCNCEEDAVAFMMQCGAVVRQIFLHKTNLNCVPQLLRLISQSLPACFRDRTMSTQLMLWRWLLAVCPDKYRKIAIYESLRAVMLLYSQTGACEAQGVALLLTHDKHTMPQEDSVTYNNACSRTACMVYVKELLGCFYYDKTIVCLIAQIVDSLLTQPSPNPVRRFSLPSHFRALDVSLSLLQRFHKDDYASLCYCNADRRRLLREHIVAVSVQWFSIFEISYGAESYVHGDVKALYDYCKGLIADISTWTLDYDEKQRRDMYSTGARTTLRYLTRFLYSENNPAIAPRSSVTEIARKFGIVADSGSAQAKENCIVFLLLAFSYQLIEHLHVAATSDISYSWCEVEKIPLPQAELKGLREDSENTLKSMMFRDAIYAAWAIYPSFALKFVEKFNKLVCRSSDNFMFQTLFKLIQTSPQQIRMDCHAVNGLISVASAKRRNRRGGSIDEDSSTSSKNRGVSLLRELLHWAPSPAPQAIDILSRLPMSSMILKTKDEKRNSMYMNPLAIQYVIRSFRALNPRTLQFYLPQLVQLLRRDYFGKLSDFLEELCVSSALLCHQLVWLLEVESVEETDSRHRKSSDHRSHGYCGQLKGSDPLPALAKDLLVRIRNNLPPSALKYLHSECDYFNAVTYISAKLARIPDKDLHNEVIEQELLSLGLPSGLYLPTNPDMRVTSVEVTSGAPMQSAAKCPFLLVFNVEPWDGPDSMMAKSSDILDAHSTSSCTQTFISEEKSHDSDDGDDLRYASENDVQVKISRSRSQNIKREGFVSPKNNTGDIRSNPSRSNRRPAPLTAAGSLRHLGDAAAQAAQSFVGAVKPGWTRFKEWQKRSLSRNTLLAERLPGSTVTPYPKLKASVGQEACIFKVYDDCRQDALTIQVFVFM